MPWVGNVIKWGLKSIDYVLKVYISFFLEYMWCFSKVYTLRNVYVDNEPYIQM